MPLKRLLPDKNIDYIQETGENLMKKRPHIYEERKDKIPIQPSNNCSETASRNMREAILGKYTENNKEHKNHCQERRSTKTTEKERTSKVSNDKTKLC